MREMKGNEEVHVTYMFDLLSELESERRISLSWPMPLAFTSSSMRLELGAGVLH